MKELQKAVAAVAPIAVRFAVGDVVRHRLLSFRGVVFDVDPEFANSEEWWDSIPEAVRPAKEQPFYHLLAENEENSYVAYVSQQNLEHDEIGRAHVCTPVINAHTSVRLLHEKKNI